MRDSTDSIPGLRTSDSKFNSCIALSLLIIDISEIVIDKKHQQLGMNPSTASGRLVKDILYKLVVDTGQNTCFQCGLPMSRDTFSIEHKEAWLDSDKPIEKYFDLDNISFSHHACNVSAARRPTKGISVCGTRSKYVLGCRCKECTEATRVASKNKYTTEKRKQQYARTGK